MATATMSSGHPVSNNAKPSGSNKGLSISTSGISSAQGSARANEYYDGTAAVTSVYADSSSHSAPVRGPSHQNRHFAASIRKQSLPPPPKAPPPPPPVNANGRSRRAQYPLETATTLHSPCSDYSEQGDFFVDITNRPPISVELWEWAYPNRPPSAYMRTLPRLQSSHQRLQSEPVAPPKTAHTNSVTASQSRRAPSVPMVVTSEGRKLLPLYVEAGRSTHTRRASKESATSNKSTRSTGNRITTFLSNLSLSNSTPKNIGTLSSPFTSGASPLFDSFTAMNAAPLSRPTSPPISAHSSDYSRSRSISTIAHEHMPAWLSSPPISSDANLKIKALENELAEVARELAMSVNRELELEAQVESLQSQVNDGIPFYINRGHSRQTSDYYSDETSDRGDLLQENGYGLPQRGRGDYLGRSRNSDDRVKLAAAEARIQVLEAELAKAQGATSRSRDFEDLVEGGKRHLQEERQQRAKFEELLQSMRTDIEQYRHERDKLRDEVVPRLQSEAHGGRKTLNHATMPKGDNEAWEESHNFQAGYSDYHVRRSQKDGLREVGSIAEYEEGVIPPRTQGMTTSNTFGPIPSTSCEPVACSRSRSRKGSIGDPTDDVEMQRKMLHHTVKALLERQAHEERRHVKHVKQLQAEIARLVLGRKRRGLRANLEPSMLEEKGVTSPLPLKMGRYPIKADPFSGLR
ncbi:hypothetical protein KEM54_006181 [Ascosphaera aggregata]|nr:hypothetical protein KEM54_006181 [Ascosphaera aggregata]